MFTCLSNCLPFLFILLIVLSCTNSNTFPSNQKKRSGHTQEDTNYVKMGREDMLYSDSGDFELVAYNKIDSPGIPGIHAIDSRGAFYTYRGQYFRTYFCYLDQNDLQVWVNYFDHETRSFGKRVNWGKPRIGASDLHAKPNIAVTPKGHIIVVQEKLGGPQINNHNSPIHIRRSVFPEDISKWRRTKHSPISHEISYPNFTVVDSVIYLLFGHGAKAIEHNHSALLRSFDDGKTWYDLNGQIMDGSDNVPQPYIIDLEAQNHWTYQHMQEVPGGFALILNIQSKGHNNSNPNSYILFSENGDTWQNWSSWVTNGKKGVEQSVTKSGPIPQKALNQYYLMGGDGTFQKSVNRRIFNFTIVNGHLIYLVEEGIRKPSDTVTYYNDFVFTVVDSNGQKIEKSFKAGSGIPDSNIQYYFYPSILAINDSTIDVIIANGKRGLYERWRTNDKGAHFYHIDDLNPIDTGLQGQSKSRQCWRQSPHKQGVFVVMSDHSPEHPSVYLGILRWCKDCDVKPTTINFKLHKALELQLEPSPYSASVDAWNTNNNLKGVININTKHDNGHGPPALNIDFYKDTGTTRIEKLLLNRQIQNSNSLTNPNQIQFERKEDKVKVLRSPHKPIDYSRSVQLATKAYRLPGSQKVHLQGELNTTKPNIIEMGFCWNTTGDPDTSHHRIVSTTKELVFTDTVQIDIDQPTNLHIKSYCIHSKGVEYGNRQLIELHPPLTNPQQIEDLKLWLDASDIDGNGILNSDENQSSLNPITYWVDKVHQDSFRAIKTPQLHKLFSNTYTIETDQNSYFKSVHKKSYWNWLHHNDVTVIVRMSLCKIPSQEKHTILATAQNSKDIGLNVSWIGQEFKNGNGDIGGFNFSGKGSTKTFIGILRETSQYWKTNEQFRNIILVMDHDAIGTENEKRVQVYIDQNRTELNREVTGTDQKPNRTDASYPLHIMSGPNGNNTLEGRISELLIYNRQLYQEEIERVFEYLNRRYEK